MRQSYALTALQRVDSNRTYLAARAIQVTVKLHVATPRFSASTVNCRR
jgi:hypothetical protein